MNKKISTPIAIIIIVLLAIIVGCIVIWQYLDMPEKEIVSEEITLGDETADWKVYRNEKYRYEIKYPNDWNSPIESGDTDALTGNYSGFFKIGNIFLAFSIDVYENDKNLSLKEWWGQEFYEKFNVKYDYSYEGMVSIFPGIEAVKYKVERAGFEDTCYLISKNQKVYTIYFSVLPGVEEIEQIISTLRFID